MQTLLWVLIGYAVLCVLCYLIMIWDHKNRGHKIPSLEPSTFPYKKILGTLSFIPGINVRIVAKIFIVRFKEWRLRRAINRDRKKIATRLRERAEVYKEKGMSKLGEMFCRIADKIENPD